MDDELNGEQSEAMEFLGPLLVPFHEGWHSALSTYLSYDPKHTADHDDSTAAGCMRCHMWTYVQNQIDGRPGITLLNGRGLKLANFWDRYVLRFKKVDRTGHHQNFQTPQQLDFDQDEDLEGVPAAAIRLTSGYQLNTAGNEIERVVIARVLGKSVIWLSQINVVAADAVWENITPARIAGTNRVDARFRRRGGA